MMNNPVTAFITNNSMGLVQDLAPLAYSMKAGNNAKVWPVNTEKIAYTLLSIEHAKRQEGSDFGGMIVPPTLEDLQAHQVIRIGNDFKQKETRVFACCSLSHIGIMTSAETAVDAYNATGCTMYIEEAETVDDIDRIFCDFYCHAIKWKAGYFKAATFPALPPILEKDVLYELPYLDFLANEDGIPGWMNFNNPLIGGGFGPTPLLPTGGDNSGRNG